MSQLTIPAYRGGYAYHGKPLRGLMSTPSSRLFQGRFGRMFRTLPPATYGPNDAASRAALMTLGTEMTSGEDAPRTAMTRKSGIPLLHIPGPVHRPRYYFRPGGTLVQRKDERADGFSTPSFDLDNVYGRGPAINLTCTTAARSSAGRPLDNGAPDLPRNNANPQER